MPKIVPSVEGPGEVKAVRILLGKILARLGKVHVGVATAKNAHGCANLKKPGGLERFIALASLDADCGAILVLMDADNGCPVTIAREFSHRIQAAGTKYPVVSVIAKCEYEAWFLASLESIAGHDLDGRPGLPDGLTYDEGDVESRLGAKGWLDRHFPNQRTYKETLDQDIMTRLLDIDLVTHRSRSFRRLLHAVDEAVMAIDASSVMVTPGVTSTANLPTSSSAVAANSQKAKKKGKRGKK